MKLSHSSAECDREKQWRFFPRTAILKNADGSTGSRIENFLCKILML